jgi:hypothetical protein
LATQPNTEAAENVDELAEEFFSLNAEQLIPAPRPQRFQPSIFPFPFFLSPSS